jgi:calcineurin-like phosphoesterase family protein
VRVFITSDHHFGHANIIKYAGRKFSSLQAMDDCMFRSWNSVVDDEDLVLHLGDVTLLTRPSRAPSFADKLQQLKGRKILIRGNHDRREMLKAYQSWGWMALASLSVGDVLFSHRPVYPLSHRMNIHGHCHGTSRGDSTHRDIGVDALRTYEPIDARQFVSSEVCYQLILLYRSFRS